MAATNAIIDPLPVLSSADKNKPSKVEVKPKTWVHIMQPRKLLPTNCPVAAGVTSKAVTFQAL